MKQIANDFGCVAALGIFGCIGVIGFSWYWGALLPSIANTPLNITPYPNLNGCIVSIGLLLIAIPVMLAVVKVIQFGNENGLWEFIGKAIRVIATLILLGAFAYYLFNWLFSR